MQPSRPVASDRPPIIGILSGIQLAETGPFPGMERSGVSQDYVSAIEAAGAVPLLVPVVGKEASVRRQIEAVDALLLSGGYDPNPLLYGENPNRRIDFIFPEIDEHQLRAVRVADELGKPMLGICRGLQILNVAFGGTLYQDLSLIPNSYIQHFQKSRKHTPGHEVSIVKDSLLAGIFEASTILINSFHHLAIKDCAPGFVVGAYAPDGVIEGIERRGGSPILAVQWHPEMMYEKYPEMLGIFEHFISLAREGRA
ncbi:MAG TPA: gamma-glutamyl-gamma-aminobutyrate hydrolase family protein [Rectinemataceae bacterium]|nr:gamma-glutamyl-gamma-aminobutyrate hydrolase family protein [Rectinemataceae bacterium]